MKYIIAALCVFVPVQAQEQAEKRGGAIAPESSLESPFDIGVSSHTNHLIRLSAATGTGSGPSGTMIPSDLHKAYGMTTPPTGATPTAIAVVVAYHYPNALNDFNTFSSLSYINLPTETSTNPTASSNKVFQVVYANGVKPRSNTGWSQEAALDIEWSHAMAPGAKIFLVEAATNRNSDLLAAVSMATTLAGVAQISMSWGGTEFSSETSNDGYFTLKNTFHTTGNPPANTPICYFAASGDTGGLVNWPSVSANVVAAGGTTLTVSSGSWSSETGWNGSGGGNSQYVQKPGWQNITSASLGASSTSPIPIGGSNRSVPDLSADADPNTGVLVVWNGGGYIFGGTSVASPCMAGMANFCGVNSDSTTFLTGLYSRYQNNLGLNATTPPTISPLGTYPFNDITSGTAGSFSCSADWDFVTGVGSPKGTASFVGP